MSVAYVPVVPPTVITPSRQTQELAELVTKVVSEYEKTHSSITPNEIQMALTLAQQRSGGSVETRRVAALAAGLAVALAGGVFAFVASAGGGIDIPLRWVEIGVVAALVVAAGWVVLRRKP